MSPYHFHARLSSPRARLFLWFVVLAIFVAAPAAGAPPATRAATPKPQGAQPAQPPVTGGETTLQPARFRPVSGAASTAQGRLSISSAGGQSSFESDVVTAPLAFSDVGTSWRGSNPAGSQVEIELRTSLDGQKWSAWQPTDEEDIDSPDDPGGTVFTSLISVPQDVHTNRFAQARITLTSSPSGEVPSVSDFKLNFINAGITAGTPSAEVSDYLVAPAKPAIIPRSAWGAPDGEKSPGWPVQFRRATHIIIHHTATLNTDGDFAARVRAVWYYHSVTRGWGDIGYNYLIDEQGNVYEGRAGGDDAAAGHAYPFNYGSVGVALIGDFDNFDPSPAMRQALIRLLAWKSAQRGIDPLGSGSFTGALDCGSTLTLNRFNISGHRDFRGSGCGQTFNTSTCPGDRVWAALPSIRTDVAAALPGFRALFQGQTTPQGMLPGGVYNATVTVRNGGSAAWARNGANPVHLAFRWYALDGSLLQSGYQDFHTDLPTAMSYGDEATIIAQVGAPDKPGIYNLSWDMVQEGVAWFGDRGSVPLTVRISVGLKDNSPPLAHVTTLNPYQQALDFTVQWGGTDELGGSGLANYDVQFKAAGAGDWTDWLVGTQAISAVFSGQEGMTYYFRSRATDLAGNVAAWNGTPDAVTTIDTTPPGLTVSSPTPAQQVPVGKLTVTGKSDTDALISVNGAPAIQHDGVFTATVLVGSADYAVSVVADDPAGNETSRTLTVRAAGRFSDVLPEYPAFAAIEYLAQRGILSGYDDSTFRPNGNATRSQYTKLLASAFKWPLPRPQTQRFSDVALDDWAAPFIESAAAQGLISGYADGTFHPVAPVTRAQVIKILVLAVQKTAPDAWQLVQAPQSEFKDVPVGHWAYPYLETAYRHGAVTLPPDTLFHPDRPATRAEISVMLYHSLGDMAAAGKMP